MTIKVSYDSRAYKHIGGTKYYRLASVSVEKDGKQVHALLTNYGPFKSEKGDMAGHKPVHGGTSSIEYFDNSTSLANKLNSEAIRRRSRSYDEVMDQRIADTVSGRTELGLQEILRGKIGIIGAHMTEILNGLGVDAALAGPGMDDVLAKARADVKSKLPKSKFGVDPRPAKAAPEPPPPPPKMPDIDRGAEWGSW